MSKIIAQGAEARIERNGTIVIKKRIKKGYRHPLLDEKIRKLRTRSEARLIEKASALIPVAKLIKTDETNKEIHLEYLAGKKLAHVLDNLKTAPLLCKRIGTYVGKMHDAGIIHGDLTTSNMIFKKDDVHIIDFGLGFLSTRVEDRAVDIYVFKEALEARHPIKHALLYKAFITGYKKSQHASAVLKQLGKVEKRGRHKAD